jgi:hypothetical protein
LPGRHGAAALGVEDRGEGCLVGGDIWMIGLGSGRFKARAVRLTPAQWGALGLYAAAWRT